MAKVTHELADSLGPFKFMVKQVENYSGEHREWNEEYTLPKGATLTREIVAAALTTAQAEAEALKQRIAELERVVAQASVWFEEYAEQHAAKAKQAVDSYEQASRRQKAARNAERAAVVRAALSENGNG